METNTNILLVGIGTLVVGLGVGYFVGMKNPSVATLSPSPSSLAHQVPDNSTMAGHMDAMTQNLQGKTGVDLEKAFLDDMIIHHQGAVDMSKMLLAGTNRPELVKFANDIINAQSAEISMMEQWRLQWFGK